MVDTDFVGDAVAAWEAALPGVGLTFPTRLNSDPVLLACLAGHGVAFSASSLADLEVRLFISCTIEGNRNQ